MHQLSLQILIKILNFKHFIIHKNSIRVRMYMVRS